MRYRTLFLSSWFWLSFSWAYDSFFLTSLYTFNYCDGFGVFYGQNNFVVCDILLQGLTKRSDRVINHKVTKNTSFLKN